MRILVINSLRDKKIPFLNLFVGLKEKGYDFDLFCINKNIPKIKNAFSNINKLYLGPDSFSFLSLLLFFILLLFFWVVYFPVLFFVKRKRQISTIICFSWKEKIIFSPLAKFLKVKVIWLELPEENYQVYPALLLRFCKKAAQEVDVITFTEDSLRNFKNLKISKTRIKKIFPGISSKTYGRQDDIFASLAKNDQNDFSRKYFTVGTILELNGLHQIENLFQAIKECLPVIPHLQLVIVGEGAERKKLTWIAKKKEIDSLVWFVGYQEYIKKWLEGFHVFVAAAQEATATNLKIVLKAKASSLPVIGFYGQGLEDLIVEAKSGFLIKTNDSELLAQKIIKLYKDKYLRKKMGDQARERVDKYFTIDKMVKSFEEILKQN